MPHLCVRDPFKRVFYHELSEEVSSKETGEGNL